MHDESRSAQGQPETEPVEPRGARLRRHGHRTRLYAWAFLLDGAPRDRARGGEHAPGEAELGRSARATPHSSGSSSPSPFSVGSSESPPASSSACGRDAGAPPKPEGEAHRNSTGIDCNSDPPAAVRSARAGSPLGVDRRLDCAVVLVSGYRVLVRALVRLRRSRRVRWSVAVAYGAVAIALTFLTARHFATTSWPLSNGDPGLVLAAGLLLLVAQALKALGWVRLFRLEERPTPLALAAGNGGARAGGRRSPRPLRRRDADRPRPPLLGLPRPACVQSPFPSSCSD